MILARLQIETDPDGERYLAGTTTSSWPAVVGTPVLLRKEAAGSYALIELAARVCQRPSEELLQSFDDGEPQ